MPFEKLDRFPQEKCLCAVQRDEDPDNVPTAVGEQYAQALSKKTPHVRYR
jgi:hypothetical protein